LEHFWNSQYHLGRGGVAYMLVYSLRRVQPPRSEKKRGPSTSVDVILFMNVICILTVGGFAAALLGVLASSAFRTHEMERRDQDRC
jgi:hypothetical protein